MKTKLLFILLLLSANANAYLIEDGPPGDRDSYLSSWYHKDNPNPLFVIVNYKDENSLFGKKETFSETDIENIQKYLPETVKINWDELSEKTRLEVLKEVLPHYLEQINSTIHYQHINEMKEEDKEKAEWAKENNLIDKNGFVDVSTHDDAHTILEAAVKAGNIKMVLFLIKHGAETKDAYQRVLKSIKGNRNYVVNLWEDYDYYKQEFRPEISALCEGSEAFEEKVNELSRILYCSDLPLLKQLEFSGEFDTQMQFTIGNRKYSPNLTSRIQDIKNDNCQGGRYENCVNHRFLNNATGLHWMVLLAPTNDVLQFIKKYEGLIRFNAKDEYGKTALDYAIELQKAGINRQGIIEMLQRLNN